MIPFHVVQQGYTVRLNTGSIPSQKINLLCSLEPAAPHGLTHAAHTGDPASAPWMALAAEQGYRLRDLAWRRKASPLAAKKCYYFFLYLVTNQSFQISHFLVFIF